MKKLLFVIGVAAVLAGFITYCEKSNYKPIEVKPGDNDPDSEFYEHKQYFMLNKHSKGNGVIIVMVGDGFSRDDNKKGGLFEKTCRQLADTLLNNPVIRDFKEYFDIYGVVAQSPTSGIHADNFFKSGAGGADFEAANAFTCEAVQGLAARIDRSWIFIGNGMIGGFANFGVNGNCGSAVYSTAEGVSAYWMSHEFVGHAFASLADEYDASSFGPGYYGGAAELNNMHRQGMGLNCSSTGVASQTPWKDFIGREGYEKVAAFEGGFGESQGIWRPEQWSIMVDNTGNGIYYNAQSRLLIYKRILLCAGESFSFDSFLEYDKINLQ
jgi:hypothetical protein